MDTDPEPVTLTVRGLSWRVGTPPQALSPRASTAKRVMISKDLVRMAFSFDEYKSCTL
jgi:hypothetical protein